MFIKNSIQRLKTFDVYKNVPKELKKSTYSGALRCIIK